MFAQGIFKVFQRRARLGGNAGGHHLHVAVDPCSARKENQVSRRARLRFFSRAEAVFGAVVEFCERIQYGTLLRHVANHHVVRTFPGY